jgi:chromosome segregation ATPase
MTEKPVEKPPDVSLLMQGARDMEWLALHMRGIMAAEAEIKRVGGIANAANEAKAKLDGFNAALAERAARDEQTKADAARAAAALMNEAQTSAAAAEAESRRRVRDAETHAASVHLNAAQHLQAAKKDALEEASRIVEAARAHAAEIMAAATNDPAHARLVEVKERLASLTADLQIKTAAHNELNRQVDGLRHEYSRAAGEIAALKAKLWGEHE